MEIFKIVFLKGNKMIPEKNELVAGFDHQRMFEIISQLYTGSLEEVIGEAIQNVIDANANHCELALDLDRGRYVCSDDGDGTSISAMKVSIQNISKIYSTCRDHFFSFQTAT